MGMPLTPARGPRLGIGAENSGKLVSTVRGQAKQFSQAIRADWILLDGTPGTGDEPLSACQLIGSPDGVLIVTTPQEIAAADVRKSVQFCRKLNLPILGILENMRGYICPKCGETTYLFGQNDGFKTAEKYNLAFLGRIPIDPNVGVCGDAGRNFLDHHRETPAARALETAIDGLLDALN